MSRAMRSSCLACAASLSGWPSIWMMRSYGEAVNKEYFLLAGGGILDAVLIVEVIGDAIFDENIISQRAQIPPVIDQCAMDNGLGVRVFLVGRKR